jgi:hypothetical protein
MTYPHDLPTVFLPPLPRQSLNTLSPLTPDTITSHVAHLRTLLVPSIYGVDTTASSTRPGSSSKAAVQDGIQSPSTSHLSGSVESSASHISAASQSSTTPHDSEVVLDEFERDWAEKWLHGLITRGEGWLAEVEPEEDQDDDESELEQGRTAEMDETTEAEWAAYTARERVLMDASALISSLAGCAGESRHALESRYVGCAWSS